MKQIAAIAAFLFAVLAVCAPDAEAQTVPPEVPQGDPVTMTMSTPDDGIVPRKSDITLQAVGVFGKTFVAKPESEFLVREWIGACAEDDAVAPVGGRNDHGREMTCTISSVESTVMVGVILSACTNTQTLNAGGTQCECIEPTKDFEGTCLSPPSSQCSSFDSASSDDSLHCAQYRLASGDDVNQLGGFGSPLFGAIYFRAITVAQFLIDNGAIVTIAKDGGITPLHEVAERSDPMYDKTHPTIFAKLLIDNGADVNAGINISLTPLDVVLSYGSTIRHAEIAQFLADNGGICSGACWPPLPYTSLTVSVINTDEHCRELGGKVTKPYTLTLCHMNVWYPASRGNSFTHYFREYNLSSRFEDENYGSGLQVVRDCMQNRRAVSCEGPNNCQCHGSPCNLTQVIRNGECVYPWDLWGIECEPLQLIRDGKCVNVPDLRLIYCEPPRVAHNDECVDAILLQE